MRRICSRKYVLGLSGHWEQPCKNHVKYMWKPCEFFLGVWNTMWNILWKKNWFFTKNLASFHRVRKCVNIFSWFLAVKKPCKTACETSLYLRSKMSPYETPCEMRSALISLIKKKWCQYSTLWNSQIFFVFESHVKACETWIVNKNTPPCEPPCEK